METTQVLEPFAWPIVVYMTLAGIAAGTVLLSALALLLGFERWRGVARRGLGVGAAGIVLGSAFLIVDLEAPGSFGLILTQFNPGSVISWGARIISLFGLLAAYTAWSLGRTAREDKAPSSGERLCLVALIGLAGAVAIYPAWVLYQSSGRPLWKSPWITPLFFVSALHTGLAALLLIRAFGRQSEAESPWKGATPPPGFGVEGLLVLAQLAFLVLYFLTLGQGYRTATHRMLSGELALWLWAGVVTLGWVFPLVEALAPGSNAQRVVLRALAILIGGLSLRALILFGGQGSAALLATVL